ncbi:ATP-binding protein [Streptomyces sp. P1-3]|uniref:ATP-binding protein n=1 Tax=Streptomyces sp. P1-3 TaxID=3421658 RepID=UPI003D36B411
MSHDLPQDWAYSLEFAHTPLAPHIARHTLRLILEAHGAAELTDTAELLTSELVTNSVHHAEGPASIRVVRNGDKGVRVSVCDTNPQLPTLDVGWDDDADAENGRGIGLVAAFADDWGGCAIGPGVFGGGGKTVWFELGPAVG